MYLVLLKIEKKIYFENLDNQNEMIDFIESIEEKFGIIDYEKSIIVDGSDENIEYLIELIESEFYLDIIGRKINDIVFNKLVKLLMNLTIDVKITHGIEFDEFDEESYNGMELTVDIVKEIINDSSDQLYSIYVYWTDENVILSLEELDIDFDRKKSFKQTFENLDESLAVFEGFRYDFMEIISEENENMLIVSDYLSEVKTFITEKMSSMPWKDIQHIHFDDGSLYKQKDVIKTIKESNDNEYMTAQEVMKKLRISDQTLSNWRRKKLIEFRKISNRKFLYYIESVNNIFENGIDTTGTAINIYIPQEKNNSEIKPIDFKKSIIELLKPYAYKVPEYKFKKQHFFLNFGNKGMLSSPQVMINNKFQLVDYIRKNIIYDTPELLYEYLIELFKDGKEPIIDTSKKIQPEYSFFYLNKLFDITTISH